MKQFSFEHVIHPRYRDLDPNGHVNNAVYATYLEEARTAYWREVVGGQLAEAGVAIVSLTIDFQAELDLSEQVIVAMRVDELGESSIPQSYVIRTADHSIATASVVMVAFDREARQSQPIPDRWRSAIRDYEAEKGTPWAID